jgi:hypothetical protein
MSHDIQYFVLSKSIVLELNSNTVPWYPETRHPKN